ncbi:MAG: reverse transcriptase domain-containing protein [Mycoplasmatales bacterium]
MNATITYQRKEKKGKVRTITTYNDNLAGQELKQKHLQYKDELYAIFEQNKTDYTYAYQKDFNVKKMVEQHLNSNYFLKVDIHSFFDNIYCERLINKIPQDKVNDNLISIILECSGGKDKGIAIGFIPSPILANIYLAEFDKILGSYLAELGNIVYTRYADDLIISSQAEFNLDDVLNFIQKLLAQDKLFLNKSKIQKVTLDKVGSHIKITGLNIIKGRYSNYISVSRKFKKKANLETNKKRKRIRKGYIKYNEHRDDKGQHKV